MLIETVLMYLAIGRNMLASTGTYDTSTKAALVVLLTAHIKAITSFQTLLNGIATGDELYGPPTSATGSQNNPNVPGLLTAISTQLTALNALKVANGG